MRRAGSTTLVFVWGVGLATGACSSSSNSGSNPNGADATATGGSIATGGTGGAPLASGGAPVASGGGAGTGGSTNSESGGSGGTPAGGTGGSGGTTVPRLDASVDAGDASASVQDASVGDAAASGGSDGGRDAATDTGASSRHVLTEIDVTPGDAVVQVVVGATGSQTFVATGKYLDGTTADLSSVATWGVASATVGAMTGATLAIPKFTAVSAVASLVTASIGTTTGTARITVVAHGAGDPVLVLPYQDPAGEKTARVAFATKITQVDAFFLADTTADMADELASFTAGYSNTVSAVANAIPGTQFGVGSMEDFPIDPYGSADPLDECGVGASAPDQPFTLMQPVTSTSSLLAAGVAALSTGGKPIGCGEDRPEAGIEALYQVATGEGLTGPSPTNVASNHSGRGGVGFRANSVPVIATISNAESHGVGETGTCKDTGEADAYAGPVATVAHSRTQLKTQLGSLCALSVGIAALDTSFDTSCSAVPYLTDLATATGARVPPVAWGTLRPAGCAQGQCCTGENGTGVAPDADGLCPLVFQIPSSGNGVASQLASGIQFAATFAAMDVPSSTTGAAGDVDGASLGSSHTTADFLTAVVPKTVTPPAASPTVPAATFDGAAFHGVTPGSTVSFDVSGKNTFVTQTEAPRLFRITVAALRDGCTTLSSHDVLVLVPATPLP